MANVLITWDTTQPWVYSQPRVPCDLRRRAVTAAPWWPYDILQENVQDTLGLIDVIAYLQKQVQELQVGLLPLLVDVNIFWRLHKLMHSVSYVACDAASALQKHPVLFGVWHAYKHCLLRVHEVFRRCWS